VKIGAQPGDAPLDGCLLDEAPRGRLRQAGCGRRWVTIRDQAHGFPF
jgi:hypothetical protein